MIISVKQAKTLIDLNDWTDEKITMKLKAIEKTIREYTNNNFQARGYRVRAYIADGVLESETGVVPFAVDDTVQISDSQLNGGIYTVLSAYDTTCTVSDDLKDEYGVLVTKIVYPEDVIDCCVKLLEWEKDYGKKAGIKSETLSRHSVTYEDSTGLFHGYPKGILNGVWHYRKARC